MGTKGEEVEDSKEFKNIRDTIRKAHVFWYNEMNFDKVEKGVNNERACIKKGNKLRFKCVFELKNTLKFVKSEMYQLTTR